jgi:hypothetical protein
MPANYITNTEVSIEIEIKIETLKTINEEILCLHNFMPQKVSVIIIIMI